jgi:4,5-DOPA dioxygenase extradiol
MQQKPDKLFELSISRLRIPPDPPSITLKDFPSGSTDKPEKMPALFLGHGSPMNTIMNNEFTKSPANLGRGLPKPRAIVVISAHWLTQTHVTCLDEPRTIHDLHGFPNELYAINYPSPGTPDYAKMAIHLKNGQIGCSYDWGLDHVS